MRQGQRTYRRELLRPVELEKGVRIDRMDFSCVKPWDFGL